MGRVSRNSLLNWSHLSTEPNYELGIQFIAFVDCSKNRLMYRFHWNSSRYDAHHIWVHRLNRFRVNSLLIESVLTSFIAKYVLTYVWSDVLYTITCAAQCTSFQHVCQHLVSIDHVPITTKIESKDHPETGHSEEKAKDRPRAPPTIVQHYILRYHTYLHGILFYFMMLPDGRRITSRFRVCPLFLFAHFVASFTLFSLFHTSFGILIGVD